METPKSGKMKHPSVCIHFNTPLPIPIPIPILFFVLSQSSQEPLLSIQNAFSIAVDRRIESEITHKYPNKSENNGTWSVFESVLFHSTIYLEKTKTKLNLLYRRISKTTLKQFPTNALYFFPVYFFVFSVVHPIYLNLLLFVLFVVPNERERDREKVMKKRIQFRIIRIHNILPRFFRSHLTVFI